jgi:hypothetical protein
MLNKDSNYDQVLNLAVRHNVLFDWGVGLNGLLILVEKLPLQLAAVINACVQGEDWLKGRLDFERFARETLAAELGNCRKRLYGDSKNPEKSHNKQDDFKLVDFKLQLLL